MKRPSTVRLALGLLASGLAAVTAGCDGVSGTVDLGPPPGADLGHDVFATPSDAVTRDAPGPGDDGSNDGPGGDLLPPVDQPPPGDGGPPPGDGSPSCKAATGTCLEDSECCQGLTCGMTTLGQVCCGNQGDTCTTQNGEDCCGALLCQNGLCTGGGGGGTVLFRAPITDAYLPQTYVSAYFDHAGKDWNCGSTRYDGHQGSDFACKNGNACIDEGRDVVAGAAGEVIAMSDGAFDRCTDATCSPPNGNFVRLLHADGSTTWYLHMKKFSIVVAVGDHVTCGQKLGQQASSGESTGAHTHFHFNASQSGPPGDPFGGPCSQPASRWVSQQNHGVGNTSAGIDQLPAPTCQP
jgi:murein DD-endopeptidase MepM/ murein hydrolase activator NlpD